MIQVTHFTNGGQALLTDKAHFARGQTHLGVLAFFRHQLRRRASRASDLPTFARLHFNIVDQRTHRNVRNRQGVTGSNFSPGAGDHRIAHFQRQRGNNVAAFAIGIIQQRNARGAIRIVFNRCNLGWNIQFVAFEIDDPVMSAAAATPMAHGNAAMHIAPAVFTLVLEQRSGRGRFRNLFKG